MRKTMTEINNGTLSQINTFGHKRGPKGTEVQARSQRRGKGGLKPPHQYSEPPHQPSALSPDISPSPAISICASSAGLRYYDCWAVWRVRLPRPSSYEVQQGSPNFSGRGPH